MVQSGKRSGIPRGKAILQALKVAAITYCAGTALNIAWHSRPDERLKPEKPQETGNGKKLKFQKLDQGCFVRGMLTPDEAAATGEVFGEGVAKRIRIVFCNESNGKKVCESNGLAGACSAAAAASEDPSVADDLLFFGRNNWFEDYTKGTLQGFKTLMHEEGHVHQSGMTSRPKVLKKYDYVLTDKTTFADLCDEQGASAIADYAARFHRPTNVVGDDYDPYGSSGERDQRLKRVVEGELPHARETRLARENPSHVAARAEGSRTTKGAGIPVHSEKGFQSPANACTSRSFTQGENQLKAILGKRAAMPTLVEFCSGNNNAPATANALRFYKSLAVSDFSAAGKDDYRDFAGGLAQAALGGPHCRLGVTDNPRGVYHLNRTCKEKKGALFARWALLDLRNDLTVRSTAEADKWVRTLIYEALPRAKAAHEQVPNLSR
jgi:hypothetical protein